MKATATTPSAYEPFYMPWGFDAVNHAVFAPFGGVKKLRNAALDRLQLAPGLRVLELGCGTGGITRLLLERGVELTSIDGSETMLARARRRAPGARFERQQVEALTLRGAFDRVLFAFVLHEVPKDLRARAFASAVAALAPGGSLAVLDHAVPRGRSFAGLWRAMLTRLEPPSVAEIIERGYDEELAAAGLEVTGHHAFAGGTAALTVARKRSAA